MNPSASGCRWRFCSNLNEPFTGNRISRTTGKLGSYQKSRKFIQLLVFWKLKFFLSAGCVPPARYCMGGGSLSRRDLCLGRGLCTGGGSLYRGRVSVQVGLCPKGSLSRGSLPDRNSPGQRPLQDGDAPGTETLPGQRPRASPLPTHGRHLWKHNLRKLHLLAVIIVRLQENQLEGFESLVVYQR